MPVFVVVGAWFTRTPTTTNTHQVAMDVNGTRFHLLYGREDWGTCRVPGDGGQPSLAELWALIEERDQPPLEWSTAGGYLQLARQTPLFRSAVPTAPLDAALRRGAGRDRYGHWYWIDPQQRGIRFLANGKRDAATFWSWQDQPVACPPASEQSDFVACPPPAPARVELCGLTVTTRHYLVVGNLTERGLLVFDLHRGGPPTLIEWPAGVAFAPWDLAATTDGGLLVLDRSNRRFWVLDSHFRLMADVGEVPALFQPEGVAGTPNSAGGIVWPQGYPLTPVDPEQASDPISIEAGPDGHVLVLYSGPGLPSLIDEYAGGELWVRYPLEEAVRAVESGEDAGSLRAISAHDFAYTACCVGDAPDCPECLELTATQSGPARTLHLIYVARSDGNQVIAFELNRAERKLDAQKDYLPLRR
jgi:hypothetical protein